MDVKKTDKVRPGVIARSEVVSLGVAARRLWVADRFPTPDLAEAALRTGEPIETRFCVYQLTPNPPGARPR